MNPSELALFQGLLFRPEGTDFRPAPARALPMWRCAMLASTAAATAVLTGLGWLCAVLWWNWTPWVLTAAALAIPYAIWKWLRLKVRWRFAGYFLDDDQLWVRGGLGHRYIEALPYGRIQLTQVSSYLWERRFGLASVRVATGTRTNTELPPLEPAEADRLRGVLMDHARERGVSL